MSFFFLRPASSCHRRERQTFPMLSPPSRGLSFGAHFSAKVTAGRGIVSRGHNPAPHGHLSFSLFPKARIQILSNIFFLFWRFSLFEFPPPSSSYYFFFFLRLGEEQFSRGLSPSNDLESLFFLVFVLRSRPGPVTVNKLQENESISRPLRFFFFSFPLLSNLSMVPPI